MRSHGILWSLAFLLLGGMAFGSDQPPVELGVAELDEGIAVFDRVGGLAGLVLMVVAYYLRRWADRAMAVAEKLATITEKVATDGIQLNVGLTPKAARAVRHLREAAREASGGLVVPVAEAAVDSLDPTTTPPPAKRRAS